MICKQDGGHKSYMKNKTCLVFIAKILIKLHWPLSYSVFTLSWNMLRPIMNKTCFTMKTVNFDQAVHCSNHNWAWLKLPQEIVQILLRLDMLNISTNSREKVSKGLSKVELKNESNSNFELHFLLQV